MLKLYAILIAIGLAAGGFAGWKVTAWQKNAEIAQKEITLTLVRAELSEAQRVAIANQRAGQTFMERCAAGSTEAGAAARESEAYRRELARHLQEVNSETGDNSDALSDLFERVRVPPARGTEAPDGSAGDRGAPAGIPGQLPGRTGTATPAAPPGR